MSLVIRPFVRDRDEPVWVDIHNRAWQEDEDFSPATVDEMKRWQDAPWVGMQARFLAEIDGIPVARVEAETDKTRSEPKGFVFGPDVTPEHRRKGIGTALMREALARLREAGMKTAESGGFDDAARTGFLSAHGFEIVRRFCRMRRRLDSIPRDVGEARDAELVILGRTDDDLALYNRLNNEAFKEHYNHTPATVDEWKFVVKNIDAGEDVMFLSVARVAGEAAGFLMYGIDRKENAYQKKKRGGLWSIGVLKQFRGQGIAKALMIAGMEHFKREGMEEAELAVDETNVTKAMRLYERLGFTVARRRLVWNKDLTAPAD